ncbi:class I SAM-dependent methyltransferase [Ulvibacterium sp.]|uniref:class I SAM-dependent methyltransferase n=1 Tax=Ulvibacterium sp. TaxID=2665914 RepID=UPI003BAAAC4C
MCDEKGISALDLEIDLHKNSERQGPGSPEDTLRALELIGIAKNKGLKLADIGCGSGGQTITLAQHIDGRITAVDFAAVFLDELNEKSKAFGIHDQISTLERPMEDLPFKEKSFDIIWSEGAIYNMGFETGIKKWREYLKPGGYLSVSEITWITHTRPKEIEDFWRLECPEINTASHNIKILEDNGYALRGYFCLKEDSWITNYYQPLEARFSSFLQRYNNSEPAREIVKAYKAEIDLYRRYKEYFSYGFYIAKKNG